jgi:spore coat protein A, manganese oxidase
MVKRRDIFKIGAVAGVALAIPAQRLVASAAVAPAEAFTVPLPIPPVLDPVLSDEHGDHYELAVMPGTARILPGVDTRMLTYDGVFPGPTIKAVRGRPARVTVTNRLATPTAVHLHGGEVPQDSDGHPLDVIRPGGSRIYRYPNHQPAASLWYHDHAHHLEAEQIYRGLSGFYLITDPATERWLPSGAYDIPLALRDTAFTDSGQLLWELGGFQRRNTVLVNGAVQPTHTVERRRYRLRLLNCANERDFRLRLGTAGFVQIGADGGLLPAPVRRTELVLSGAERADVIVDFSRFKSGSTLVLENLNGDADVNTNILRFVVAGDPVPDDSVVPATLSGATAIPVLPRAKVTRRRVEFGFDLTKAEFLINGRGFDPHRVDFTIKQGATEIWEIFNNPDPVPVAHSLHLHLVQFRVLDRDGVPVESWEAYPKDTVAVHPGETVRILVRFHSRFTGRYPFHCHFVDHSSVGMMAQMEIIP